MANVKFELDRQGGAEILKNNRTLIGMQDTAMNQVLSIVQANFFQTFGVEGEFEIRHTLGDRRGVAIIPSSKRTRAILNSHPGWLSTYMNNIRI